jgi:hypothetical protein
MTDEKLKQLFKTRHTDEFSNDDKELLEHAFISLIQTVAGRHDDDLDKIIAYQSWLCNQLAAALKAYAKDDEDWLKEPERLCGGPHRDQ